MVDDRNAIAPIDRLRLDGHGQAIALENTETAFPANAQQPIASIASNLPVKWRAKMLFAGSEMGRRRANDRTYLEQIWLGIQVFAIAATDVHQDAAHIEALQKAGDPRPRRMPRLTEMLGNLVVHLMHILQFASGRIVDVLRLRISHFLGHLVGVTQGMICTDAWAVR